MAIFDKKKLQKIKEKITKKHTIMIVDDEEAHLRSMESLLSEDYYIITALDGQEAFDIIQRMKKPEEISLIISDQRMPKISGIQFFERIKDIIPNTLRIILTAYDDKDVIIDSINKAKIYEFILKPFDPYELKIRVKRAVEEFERLQ
jgi:two-component system cell cycle response regulator